MQLDATRDGEEVSETGDGDELEESDPRLGEDRLEGEVDDDE